MTPVSPLRELVGPVRHPLAQLRVAENPQQGLGVALDVALLHEQARLSVGDRVFHAAAEASHPGHAAGIR